MKRTLAHSNPPRNLVDAMRLRLLAWRRDRGEPLPAVGQALLLALDRKAANRAEGQ